MPDMLEGLDRKELLALRRRINEQLHKLEEDKHAAVVAAGITMPPGWGETDGDSNDEDVRTKAG